ncbi:hypothetical protein HBH56_147400 [Parastagonospora nodorum]|uniref:NmrA-like domain-containing protein n=2 Tax=Phaeosphaeria nodorum (strain SN15 / ATCC MYA-4574 / FGSC 10173) TaxID=321614 RepID=Q0ULQ3_PHANO|nr:hypothetical protein SNOG_07311 [Parastagonospora nodorum SN15]KAH3910116.1 hypothetical protein HBH56_147400 [Parastagonospora nodorum]EAT84777.1 hypothetical protein SNOG_07311 [Parastagonospora nodorum SN15]KAH3923257.1 hypothetical protein HBH54_212040 [Parastagonospora nodorum]KAH4037602.1 hypothetical protein HBI09_056460 [Parastagonospora nodorum]KAH4053905.1 hypothetical protein HBH49_073250 [Parastagonospora nodorum]
MGKLALTSATGKLGSAVIHAILDNNLISPEDLVVCTSSDPSSPKLQYLQAHPITVRHATFDSPSSLSSAYAGCTALFLVSTPRIEMDYNNASLWRGREAHHRAAIDAAVKAGVKHIYYTSLAFADPSKAGVMRAHIRTEEYLRGLEGVGVTVLREGLYCESWPLYFGYYFGLKGEKRREVVVAGDGKVSWTSIDDMAFCTAKVLAEPGEKWAGRTVYLSQKKTRTLEDVAGIVSRVRGEEVGLKVVERKEYEDYYVGRGMERASVEWWSSTYDALRDGECAIDDDTLETILKEAGRTPKSLDETIEEMMQ